VDWASLFMTLIHFPSIQDLDWSLHIEETANNSVKLIGLLSQG
jgi:hypothetical protein